MKYESIITNLFNKFFKITFNKKEEEIWNAWLNLKKRECRDLKDLLDLEVRLEFKARALTILLSPDTHALPFRWDYTENSLSNYLFLNWIKVKEISPNLWGFMGELIYQNVEYCWNNLNNEKMQEVLFFYNNTFIPGLLSVLPEDGDLADTLFKRFQVNDPLPYCNMETQSGYNPFYIMLVSDVPDKWKNLVEQKMQDRIMEEIKGDKHPREKWEDALKCYTDHIQMMNYNGEMGYSRDIFISQMNFIVELPNIEKYETELFSSWQFLHILQTLKGDDLYDLRHKLSRLIVLFGGKENDQFSISDRKSRNAANLIIKEFGAIDQQLKERLNFLIEEEDRRQTQNNLAKEEKESQTNALLEKMK
jgi:hypothetical protein